MLFWQRKSYGSSCITNSVLPLEGRKRLRLEKKNVNGLQPCHYLIISQRTVPAPVKTYRYRILITIRGKRNWVMRADYLCIYSFESHCSEITLHVYIWWHSCAYLILISWKRLYIWGIFKVTSTERWNSDPWVMIMENYSSTN